MCRSPRKLDKKLSGFTTLIRTFFRLSGRKQLFSTKAFSSTATDFQTAVAERHIDEAGIVVGAVLQEFLANAGRRLGIFCDHVEVAATACAGEFVAEAEVVDEGGDSGDFGRIRAAVELLILLPRFSDKTTHFLEILALQCLVHLHRMLLHQAELRQFVVLIEEHPTHNLGENLLGGARDARVIQQMAGAMVGMGENAVGKPSDNGLLMESALGFEQFHACEQAAELVLPTAARREELFENQRATANLVFVPRKTAEIAQRAQNRACENGTRAEPAACRNRREHRQFDACAKGFQAVGERSVFYGGKFGQKTGESERSLRNREGTSHAVVVGELLVGFDDFGRSEVDTP